MEQAVVVIHYALLQDAALQAAETPEDRMVEPDGPPVTDRLQQEVQQKHHRPVVPEGVAAEDAIQYTIEKIELLRRTYPGKRIVVAEFGWPSQGYNRNDAVPGPLEQAKIIRDFVAEAERRGIEYNIIEAFDQK